MSDEDCTRFRKKFLQKVSAACMQNSTYYLRNPEWGGEPWPSGVTEWISNFCLAQTPWKWQPNGMMTLYVMWYALVIDRRWEFFVKRSSYQQCKRASCSNRWVYASVWGGWLRKDVETNGCFRVCESSTLPFDDGALENWYGEEEEEEEGEADEANKKSGCQFVCIYLYLYGRLVSSNAGQWLPSEW